MEGSYIIVTYIRASSYTVCGCWPVSMHWREFSVPPPPYTHPHSSLGGSRLQGAHLYAMYLSFLTIKLCVLEYVSM
jgi:hypothetical protein